MNFHFLRKYLMIFVGLAYLGIWGIAGGIFYLRVENMMHYDIPLTVENLLPMSLYVSAVIIGSLYAGFTLWRHRHDENE